MVIAPKEKPVIRNLNTYYLDIRKLVEHYQGEIGSGGVFFRSVKSEAVLFFDQNEILNAYFREPEKTLYGQAAIKYILAGEFDFNLLVDIYRLNQSDIYFWSNLPGAERIYKDLSTDFTDLDGLVKKMEAEKLTGYIEVSIQNQPDGGIIFISNGGIVGGSFSWENAHREDTAKNLKSLIEKTKAKGGIFQVSRLTLHEIDDSDESNSDTEPALEATIVMLEELLGIFETLYSSLSSKNNDFENLLRKKFMENLDRYDFLDPFAAEFEYENRKVTYTGVASDTELTIGVCLSVKELADELGLMSELRRYLNPWYNKYESRLKDLDITF